MKTMDSCKSCKSPIKKGQKFCLECGAAVPAETLLYNEKPGGPDENVSAAEASLAAGHKAALCPLCGTAYPPSACYCENDGTLLGKVEAYMLTDLSQENP
jgi:predicted nucleic acid-binding Zn ribbon protein